MTQTEVTTQVSDTETDTAVIRTAVKEDGHRTRCKEGKVFSHLVDKAAFVDTITLSVDSDHQPRLDQIADANNQGILSRKSNYSRMVTGKWEVTGNPVTILYGRAKRFSAIPPCRLTVRSESVPLTGAQVNCLKASVFPDTRNIWVSSVELTFDVSSVSFEDVMRSIVYRATRTRKLQDWRGRRTLYIGSPRSFWFARIYEKRTDVLRLEFALRRGFLSSRSLDHPNDLVALRTLEISKLICLRRASSSRISMATENWPAVAHDWWMRSATKPTWLLNRIASANSLDARWLLPKSRNQQQLEAMQRLLVW